MKLEYVTGDLVRSDEAYIVQGCNAKGRMGKGLAKQIRDDYPKAYTTYVNAFDKRGLALGQIVVATCDHDQYGKKTIFNAITQDDYRKDDEPPGMVYVSYDAVREVFNRLDQLALATHRDGGMAKMFNGPITRIGIPLIGAGLAGGDWNIIADIIESESENFRPIVYLFDGKMP